MNFLVCHGLLSGLDQGEFPLSGIPAAGGAAAEHEEQSCSGDCESDLVVHGEREQGSCPESRLCCNLNLELLRTC